MTPRFLVGINALVLGVSALAAIEFAAPLMRILWLAVASSVGINGIWHLQATLRTRRYSPGVATGTLLYAPLVSYAFVHFVHCGWTLARDALSAASYGAAYWIFSEGRKLLKRESRATSRARLSVLR